MHARARKLLVSVSSLSVSVSLPFFTSFLLCSLLFLHFWSRAEAGCCCVRTCVSLAFSLTLFIFSLCMCILVYIYLSLSFSVSPPLSLYANENTTLNSRMNSNHGHQLTPLLGTSIYGPTCFEARARTSTFLSCHEQSFRGTTDERGRH